MNDRTKEEAEADEILRTSEGRMFFSPVHYDPSEHGEELYAVLHEVLERRGRADADAVAQDEELIASVIAAHEVLAARRVQQVMREGNGLAAFVGEKERLPIKKELAEKMERAFLLLADALVAVNRGDLDFLELGQSSRAEVARMRSIHEKHGCGDIDRNEAMSQLCESFVCLDDAYGARPFLMDELESWGDRQPYSVWQAVRFVRAVWTRRGVFGDAIDLFDSMDDQARRVVQAFILHPFKP